MNKLITLIAVLLFSITLFAQNIEKEKEAIKSVIQTAYVDGLQNNGEVEDIKAGIHEGFNLLGIYNDQLTKYPIYSWIESFEKRKKENPTPPTENEKIICDYLLIDITGNAAMAKIQLKKDGKLLFTDYLQLYKFEEGWRMVSKIYFRH